jgi:CRP-like cAMP-binding protein
LQVTALRLDLAALGAEFERRGHMHDLLLRYLHTLVMQITQSALCNRYHTIEQRLCRWLLISRDRARSDYLALTQASLARMLGSQRTGVTAAAAVLQRGGSSTTGAGRLKFRTGGGLRPSRANATG